MAGDARKPQGDGAFYPAEVHLDFKPFPFDGWASFFVAGAPDPVLVNRPPDNQDEWLPDHRGSVIIEDAGHSVQQEEPEQVNAALLDFLESIDHRAGYGSGRERWVRSCGRGPP